MLEGGGVYEVSLKIKVNHSVLEREIDNALMDALLSHDCEAEDIGVYSCNYIERNTE